MNSDMVPPCFSYRHLVTQRRRLHDRWQPGRVISGPILAVLARSPASLNAGELGSSGVCQGFRAACYAFVVGWDGPAGDLGDLLAGGGLILRVLVPAAEG